MLRGLGDLGLMVGILNSTGLLVMYPQINITAHFAQYCHCSTEVKFVLRFPKENQESVQVIGLVDQGPTIYFCPYTFRY